jgi:hypothetical protein
MNPWPVHNDNLVKSPLRTYYSAGEGLPLPPFEVNSNGSALTLGRSLLALGLVMDFLRVHHHNNLALSTALSVGPPLQKADVRASKEPPGIYNRMKISMTQYF